MQDMLQNILESYQDKAEAKVEDGLKGGNKKVRKDGGSKQRRSSKPQYIFFFFLLFYIKFSGMMSTVESRGVDTYYF